MEILYILALGFVCMACFKMGAKVGQAVAKGEKIETPVMNPMQAVKERRAKQEAQEEQERLDVIQRNIECYDGTSRGQEDVPGR
jgi:hypothetical protein